MQIPHRREQCCRSPLRHPACHDIDHIRTGRQSKDDDNARKEQEIGKKYERDLFLFSSPDGPLTITFCIIGLYTLNFTMVTPSPPSFGGGEV